MVDLNNNAQLLNYSGCGNSPLDAPYSEFLTIIMTTLQSVS